MKEVLAFHEISSHENISVYSMHHISVSYVLLS